LVFVEGGVLERVVIAVDPDFLKNPLVVEDDDITGGRGRIELSASTPAAPLVSEVAAASVDGWLSGVGESLSSTGIWSLPASLGSHSCQPCGASGHEGSGFHPLGGTQPSGGFGHPGGGLKVRCSSVMSFGFQMRPRR
jgi:hypothetical protein